MTQCTNKRMGKQWAHHWDQHWQTFLLATLSISNFLGFKNQQFVFDMLTTHLLSSNKRVMLTISWLCFIVFTLHPALKFTFEKEHDGKLPFFDILVERTELSFQPAKTKNKPNCHISSRSTYDMYKKQETLREKLILSKRSCLTMGTLKI